MIDAPAKPGVVRKLLNKSITALENFSSAVIMIMMLLTFADVIGRYILNKPVFGATEMISALLALAIFSGLGVANARDDHITVELFEEPVRDFFTPLVYETIIQIFSIAVMLTIAVVLYEHAIESYEQNALTVVLEIPLAYITGSIAFLALLSVLSQLVGIYFKLYELKKSEAKE